MANIKSSIKDVRKSRKRRAVNVARKSDIKSTIKKFVDAIASNNVNEAGSLLRDVNSKLARAASKGLVKKQTAARKVSRLAQKLAKANK